MTKIFIDIETIPAQPEDETKEEIANTIKPPAAMSKPETIQDWHDGAGKYAGVKDAAVEAAYRATSFDGGKGEVISVAFGTCKDNVMTMWRELGDIEASLLQNMFDVISNMSSNHGSQVQPYFIGHYVAGFDLKFLYQRAIVLRVKPPFDLPFSGRHEKDFYCTQQAWAGYGGKISQDNLCKALGIPGKPADMDGSKVWDFVKAGEIEAVADYNKDDVLKNIEIYNRLHFI